jgi:hypothetical protein
MILDTFKFIIIVFCNLANLNNEYAAFITNMRIQGK